MAVQKNQKEVRERGAVNLQFDQENLFLEAGSVIRDNNNNILGYIFILKMINKAFLEEIKNTTSADMSLFLNHKLHLTTLSSSEDRDLANEIAVLNKQWHMTKEKTENNQKQLKTENMAAQVIALSDMNNKFSGELMVSISLDSTKTAGSFIRKQIIIASLIILVITVLLGSIMSRWLTKPVELLAKATKTIAEGNLDQRVHIKSHDEFESLANSFNTMTDSLKEINKEIKENEQKMSKILETALDAVITIDSHGIVTNWNKQAEIIFGWSQEEILGKKLSNTIIPTQHRGAHDNGMKHFMKTGEGPVLNKRMEMKAMRKNGREFDIELAITPIQTKDNTFFSGFIRDITYSNQAKGEIRKLSHVVEQSTNAVYITDLKGIIEYVNPRVAFLTGFQRSEVIGEIAHVFQDGVFSNEEQKQIWQAIKIGEKWIGRALRKKRNKETYWERVSISPIRDYDNKIIYILISCADITKEIEAEEEMKKALAMKNEFTSTISHELRTPLAISKQALSLLSREKRGVA